MFLFIKMKCSFIIFVIVNFDGFAVVICVLSSLCYICALSCFVGESFVIVLVFFLAVVFVYSLVVGDTMGVLVL